MPLAQVLPSSTISHTDTDHPGTPPTGSTSDLPSFFPSREQTTTDTEDDRTAFVINSIIDKIQRALKLKSLKKSTSNTQARILFGEITDSLWALPSALQSSSNAQDTISQEDYASLNSKY